MGCPPAGARPLAGTSPTTATPNDTNACLIVIGASLGRGLYHDPRTTCLNGDASLVTLLLPIWPSPRGAASTTRGCAVGILTGHQRLDLLPRCQRITRPRPWPRGVIYGSKLRHTPAPAARTSRRRARRHRGTDENQAIAARSARARRPQVLAHRHLQAVVGPQLRAGDRRRRRRRRPRAVRP